MKEIQILLLSLVNLTGAPSPIVGRCRRERKCVARRTVRGATQECLYILFFHTPFTILLHDFIFDTFVVTPVLTFHHHVNLLFVCNIPSNV